MFQNTHPHTHHCSLTQTMCSIASVKIADPIFDDSGEVSGYVTVSVTLGPLSLFQYLVEHITKFSSLQQYCFVIICCWLHSSRYLEPECQHVAFPSPSGSIFQVQSLKRVTSAICVPYPDFACTLKVLEFENQNSKPGNNFCHCIHGSLEILEI